MSVSKSLARELHDPFYRVKVWICYNKSPKYIKKKTGHDIDPQAYGTIITLKEGGHYAICFRKKDINTVVHEVVHLVDMVFRYKGIENEDEARAYYIAGWVDIIRSVLK